MKSYIELKTIAIYLLICFSTILILEHFWFQGIFSWSNYLNFDAEHYEYIMQKGYKGFRVAFFPLFPMLWKLFNLAEHGVIILNGLIFIISFYILLKTLKINNPLEILLYISIPSSIFYFLPYSEAVFFLSSVILLFGIKNDKQPLVYLGLFLALLSRPAFTIFVPALFIVEFLFTKGNIKYQRIFIYCVITVIGLSLVGLIQYFYTAEWFKFFSAQKGWGNELQIPKLHLTTWGGNFVVRLDAIAFLTGILSGTILFLRLIKFDRIKLPYFSKEVVFSMAYLGGITLSVLLFRGGSLFSLNRFVFAAPFIIILLNFWLNHKITLSLKKIGLVFLAIFAFWTLFGSYVHIQSLIKFLLITFYVILFFTLKSKQKKLNVFSLCLLILLNFTFQIVFYIRFLNEQWIG